ncbi:hypothetical protein [Acinetobacter sp.]|uniref:hypothetical protein n=1 Tax=Acinetobacter sp. TaxID=472 RepID=UPI00388F250E
MPLPSPPYKAGQYPRIGYFGWSASTEQYDFTPATEEEIQKHAPRELTVHDHFDAPMDPESIDGQDTLRKMAHYIETGELPDAP